MTESYPLQISVPRARLAELLHSQLRHLMLLDEPQEPALLAAHFDAALARLAYLFGHINNKYYRRDGQVFFNPWHTAQYGIFLYLLAQQIHRAEGAIPLCDKLYGLNKVINAVDLFYEVQLPDVFFMDHPVGTVLGRARYGRFFSFSQGSTVGNNRGIFPTIGERVALMSGASLIGNCHIGNHVVIATGACVLDQDVPDDSIVFGRSPNLVIKPIYKNGVSISPVNFFVAPEAVATAEAA
ncbi:MAG: transferase [Burkholderiales bacterium PBB5]|nr:MAG: transferase [Burkholderiales bacterium PBB5]